MQAALTGLLVTAALAVVKLLAGILGHSYALVTDAIESSTDIFSGESRRGPSGHKDRRGCSHSCIWECDPD